MALTDTAIRNTKPADNPLKLTDERGLYLLLKPNGSRWWRFDYREITSVFGHAHQHVAQETCARGAGAQIAAPGERIDGVYLFFYFVRPRR